MSARLTPAAPGPALPRLPQRRPLLFPPGAGPLAPLPLSSARLGSAAVRAGGGRGCSVRASRLPADRPDARPGPGARARSAEPGRREGLRPVGSGARGGAAASSPPAAPRPGAEEAGL